MYISTDNSTNKAKRLLIPCTSGMFLYLKKQMSVHVLKINLIGVPRWSGGQDYQVLSPLWPGSIPGVGTEIPHQATVHSSHKQTNKQKGISDHFRRHGKHKNRWKKLKLPQSLSLKDKHHRVHKGKDLADLVRFYNLRARALSNGSINNAKLSDNLSHNFFHLFYTNGFIHHLQFCNMFCVTIYH